MQAKWVFALIGIAVFLAGCIQLPGRAPTTRGIAAGVIVKSFFAVTPEIYSGDDAHFTFTIENTGESDATNVNVKLFGLGTDWTPSTDKKDIGFLPRANPAQKIPGGIASDEFTSKSPAGLKVDTTYSAFIRVTYNYATSGRGSIKLYNKAYLDALPVEEAKRIRSTSGIEYFITTSGPIQVSLVGLPRPLEDGKDTKRSVTLSIENVGQGGNYLDTEGDRKVRIKTFTIGNTDCTKQPDFDLTPALPRVGAKMITCKFNLPSVTEYTTIPVTVELEYNYFVDASTNIKVLRIPV